MKMTEAFVIVRIGTTEYVGATKTERKRLLRCLG